MLARQGRVNSLNSLRVYRDKITLCGEVSILLAVKRAQLPPQETDAYLPTVITQVFSRDVELLLELLRREVAPSDEAVSTSPGDLGS